MKINRMLGFRVEPSRKIFRVMRCSCAAFAFVCVTLVSCLGLMWNMHSLVISSRHVLRNQQVHYTDCLTPGTTANISIYIHIPPDVDRPTSNAKSGTLWKFVNNLSEICTSLSSGYYYNVNFLLTLSDQSSRQKNSREELRQTLEKTIKLHCTPESEMNVHVVFLSVQYPPEKVAWALGEVIWEQYIEGVEYFYIGRPETLVTRLDLQQLHKSLLCRKPSNFGILFPNDGKELFFHATHLEIFGMAFPRTMPGTEAYTWLRMVYQNEMLAQDNVDITLADNTTNIGKRLRGDWGAVKRYKTYLSGKSKEKKPEGKLVISMSLYGTRKRYTNNAVRNALLVKLHFPAWTLRFYVGETEKQKYQVPSQVLKKLVSLGSELKFVNSTATDLPPMHWRFLVADDPDVYIFIIRDCDSLLSNRDATVVNEWLRTGKAFHCVRDHPSHVSYEISGGLWGARRAELAAHIGKCFKDLMVGQYNEKSHQDTKFLRTEVWPTITNYSYCHDSVSCDRWPSSHPFPVARIGHEHMGAVFDEFGDYIQGDVDRLKRTPINKKCIPGQIKTK